MAASMTSCMDMSITSWTCSSHFSTAPRASDVEICRLSFTFSPSLENMARMSSLESNSSLAIPSKHFLRCGCTRIGSFVSERISSISSFDRKKKLRRQTERLTVYIYMGGNSIFLLKIGFVLFSNKHYPQSLLPHSFPICLFTLY